MPLIANVMSEARTEFAELDRIAVTVGPGSFTGLRVGVSAARGIGLAAGKPVVGLTTLSALAVPLIDADDSQAVLAVIDARHGNVYMQLFGPGGRTLVAPRVAPLGDAIRAAMASPTRVVGNAARLVEAAWPDNERRPLAGERGQGARHRVGRKARRRRRSRSRFGEAALSARRPTPIRRRPACCRGNDDVSHPARQDVPAAATPRRSAGDFAGRARGCAVACNSARRSIPPRLERGRIRAPAGRAQCGRRSRHGRRPARRIRGVADRRRRGGDPLDRGCIRIFAAPGSRAACSTCICGGWQATASPWCFSRSTSTTRRRAGSMRASVSPRSAAAKAIMLRRAAALVLRRHLS